MKWVKRLWGLIVNPPIEMVGSDGEVVYEEFDRRDRLEMMKPYWWYKFCATELECGCTRRWWGRFTLYAFECETHFPALDENDSEPPDANCFTRPDGECIGTDCMHDRRSTQ